ncbi:hypothetical protein KC571_01515 [candidate division WWE3 bacterium]|uniref:Uncharacterized protein n=1 Tax=candidate division WWE3 bacterium TaxID=2053526 RepID=A0A955RQ34_UNCKA|nr:hypothetical protein [candidate division WWE3 bacterium]
MSQKKIEKTSTNNDTWVIDTSKFTKPAVILVAGILIGVVVIAFIFFDIPDQSPDGSDILTPTPEITPMPSIYEVREEDFQSLRDEGLLEITAFKVTDQYPENDELLINGELQLSDDSVIQIIGVPARSTLYLKMDGDFFAAAEQNYDVYDYLQGEPIFYDLDESINTLAVRTISAGQEYKMLLEYKELIKT